MVHTQTYLLQVGVSREVTAHEYVCFLPPQHSEGEEQPHKGIILTGINYQFVPHLDLSHVLALLQGTVLQTVFQHLKNATAQHPVHTRLDLSKGIGNVYQNGLHVPFLKRMVKTTILTLTALTILRNVLQISLKLSEPLKFLSNASITSCGVSNRIWVRCRLR